MGIGGIGSLGDDMLNYAGRVKILSSLGGAKEGGEKRHVDKPGAQRPIRSYGVVHIFTHKYGQYAIC